MRTSRTGRTSGANTTRATGTTLVNNLEEEVKEATLVEASTLHFIFNFLAERHVTIYKRKIIFIPR
jgi:hypothetical protein